MIADANLQVWLETDASTRPPMVTPYVQASQAQRIDYQLYAIKKGSSGTSRVSQSGTVQALPKTPTALSSLSLSAGKKDACQIELILAKGGIPIGTYHFECPR